MHTCFQLLLIHSLLCPLPNALAELNQHQQRPEYRGLTTIQHYMRTGGICNSFPPSCYACDSPQPFAWSFSFPSPSATHLVLPQPAQTSSFSILACLSTPQTTSRRGRRRQCYLILPHCCCIPWSGAFYLPGSPTPQKGFEG